MFDILSIIPGKKKHTSSGWTSFNAICCNHRGHRSDTRQRGGVKLDGNNWVMHCFNCGYSCSFTLGKSISSKTRQFLQWCGIDKLEIQRWSLESLQQRDLLDLIQPKQKQVKIKFNDHELPEGELLDENNPKHKVYVDYVRSREIDINRYPFLITPHENGRMANRVIVPYTYKNKIVGHTSRFLDNKTPKYINQQQQGYVFNVDAQHPEWQVCIVTEGIFDALSIDGVAVMHDDISPEQAMLLATLNRQIIVAPDRDKTGLNMIDPALELGYKVSLPNWDSNVKDTNDAVIKYGKLPTLLSILESATHSKIKLELRKKQIDKGL
jgi:transcription elongation factor Elf1